MEFFADNSLHLLLSMLQKTKSGEALGRGQEMEQEAGTFLVVHALKNKACL